MLGFEVAVLAVVTDAEAFANSLTRQWHAAFAPRERWFSAFDTYDAMPWTVAVEPLPMDERWMGGRALPTGFRIADGMLAVALAPGGTVDDFEAAFAASMEDLAFDRVAARPGEVAWRFRTGRPLVIGPRYSRAPRSPRMSHEPLRPPEIVKNLYAFRPRSFRHLVGRASDARTIVGVRAALAATRRGREATAAA